MLFLAHIAHAQGTFEKVSHNSTVVTFVTKIMQVIVLPIMGGFFVFTILMFIWGVAAMIRNADSPEARETGQRHILWGVIGMAIMVSAYGIIRVIASTIGVPDPFL